MRPALPRGVRPRAWLVLGAGALVLLQGLWSTWPDLWELVLTHEVAIIAFVVAIAGGELVRLRMPSGRDAAPLASASALALAFLGEVFAEPTFRVPAGFVVLVVATGIGLATVVRGAQGRGLGLEQSAARLIGVAVAAWAARDLGADGTSLWDRALDPDADLTPVAMAMVAVAALGLVVETVLSSAVRSERQRSPWSISLRDELGEVAPLTFAVVASGPLVALMAPAFGLASLPAALFPLAITYVAVARYARNRATYRQTIATLSRLTEEGGYTPAGHAERVAEASVRVGRLLGLSDRELREVEYAALLHDLGQISLSEPIPGGATVLAAPSDQQDIAAEGARIIRHAEGLDAVAGYVEAQTTRYRQVLELGEPVPLASRIIKVTNAFDDLTGGRRDPAEVETAMERIHLGLGYEYDPAVVEALTLATHDTTVGWLGEREPVAR
ncbi:MAG TPA: HD domain-containing phosphohydrolase [Ornithinibacter sp.]|nr:HD domain-containing phosphohydrolase [Ornithinibacter sp.]